MAISYVNYLGEVLKTSAASTKTYIGTKAVESFLGTSGNDVFRGNGGVDSYAGGKGDDIYIISSAKSPIIELAGEGVDTVRSVVAYTLGANLENLTLEGPAWYGGGNELNNIITGNDASQQLDGGAGNDVLVGGLGADTFIVTKGNGSDVIADFDPGADKIRLAGYGITSFDQVKAIAVQVGDDTRLDFANGEHLLLRGLDVADLNASQFELSLDASGLKQTFGDEFNSLSLLNQGGTWRTEYGHGGAGTIASHTLNDESQIYMDASYAGTGTKPLGVNPFSISSDGILTITAAPTPEEVKPFVNNYSYTSGLLTSKFTFSQQYGYFEIRAAMPEGQGFWPAFWMMPTDNTWPPELDVFEQLGKDPTTVYMTTHYESADGKHQQTQSRAYVDTTEFHTYGVNWGPDTITYYIDGNAVAKQATPESMKKEMYLLINLAVGGDWSGAPDATTGTGEMKVDYVRAFATQDTVSTTVNGVHTTYKTAESVTSAPATAPVPAPVPVVNTITGTDGADTLKGTGGDDLIIGGAGNDSLIGLGGKNELRGGLGDDIYRVTTTSDVVVEKAGEGTDAVYSTVSFTLSANVETLKLEGTNNINGTGNELNNRLIGNAANNVLSGGLGNDYLDGGTGIDTLIGGKGDDVYVINQTGTKLTEIAGEGTDSVWSTVSWTLGGNFETLKLQGTAAISGFGNELANRMFGNTANNILDGKAGNDIIDGGAGNDVITGGTGTDLMTGGAGYDKFNFTLGFGKDRITDFNVTEDKLSFVGLAKSSLHLTQVGADTVIDFGGADTITLVGVNAKDPALMSHLLF